MGMFSGKTDPKDWPWVKIGENGATFYAQANIASTRSPGSPFEIRRMTQIKLIPDPLGQEEKAKLHAEFVEKYKIGAAMRNNDHQRMLLEQRLRGEEDAAMSKLEKRPDLKVPLAVDAFAKCDEVFYHGQSFIIAMIDEAEAHLLSAFWCKLEEGKDMKL